MPCKKQDSEGFSILTISKLNSLGKRKKIRGGQAHGVSITGRFNVKCVALRTEQRRVFLQKQKAHFVDGLSMAF